MPAPSTPARVTRWRSYHDVSGAAVEVPWPALLAELKQPADFLGDSDHPGWSPIVCQPATRKDEHVRRLCALVLDYDGGAAVQGAAELWGGYYGLIHTTRKHTVEVHRFRVVLPLSRHVSPAEYARLWAWAYERATRAGHRLDASTRNVSRFWYLPGTKPGGAFEAVDLDGSPLDVDGTLLAFDARQRTNTHPPPREGGASSSLLDRMKRAKGYLARMDAAVAGQGGHAATWGAAVVLVRGFALDVHAALDLLEHEYNPRCNPPWSRRELEHKAVSAERDGKLPVGYLLEDERRDWRAQAGPMPAAAAEPSGDDGDVERDAIRDEAPAPTEEEVKPPRVSAFTKLSALDIFAPLPPVPWLVEKLDICPGAPAMFAGYGYSRKTIAAQALALSIAAGRRVWGEFDARRGKTLHLDYEQGARLTRERYQRLARALDITPDDIAEMLDLVVLPQLYLDSATAADVLARECEGYDLVIIDSFRAAAPSADENSSDVRRHLDVLTRVSELTGVTPLLIHHARKPSKEQSGDARMALRGSSGIFDACSSILVFSAEKGEPTRVQHEKARTSGVAHEDFYIDTVDIASATDPRSGLRVLCKTAQQVGAAAVVHEDEESALKFAGLCGRILEILRKDTSLPSASAVARRLGLNKARVLEAVRDLQERGKIAHVGGFLRVVHIGEVSDK